MPMNDVLGHHDRFSVPHRPPSRLALPRGALLDIDRGGWEEGVTVSNGAWAAARAARIRDLF